MVHDFRDDHLRMGRGQSVWSCLGLGRPTRS